MDDLQRARACFPEIRLDAAASQQFTAHVATCRDAGARTEHLGDVLLAWAAGRGDAEALRRFETYVGSDVTAAARRVDPAPGFASEVMQSLRVRLLVAETGARPRIAEYTGRGPLRGWVGVAALRVALNLKRDRAPDERSTDVLAEVVAREPDPELRHLKTLYRAEFREALGAALAALPERSRAVLRLTFVDGLRLAQLGRLYGVHESTASRWVSQAAAAVAEDARRRLVERLAVSADTARSVARMVLSDLDLSIARLLGQ